MESIEVLTLSPMFPYLEQELDKRFNHFRFWNYPHKTQCLNDNANSIHAIVADAGSGADARLIEALLKLEIVSSFSVGVDRIDLIECKERGISVTNTPHVLTDQVADLAIGLILALLRTGCEFERYVRSGKWKHDHYKLTTKFFGKSVGIIGLGRIGTAIAKRAEAFNCSICYYSGTDQLPLS